MTANRADEPASYLSTGLATLAAAAHVDYAALAAAVSGQWTVQSETGTRQPFPTDLLAESLDREALAHVPAGSPSP